MDGNIVSIYFPLLRQLCYAVIAKAQYQMRFNAASIFSFM